MHENQFWYHAISLPFNRSPGERGRGRDREFTIARWNKQLTSVPFNWNPRLCLLIMSHRRRRRLACAPLSANYNVRWHSPTLERRTNGNAGPPRRQIATLLITWIALIHRAPIERSCGSIRLLTRSLAGQIVTSKIVEGTHSARLPAEIQVRFYPATRYSLMILRGTRKMCQNGCLMEIGVCEKCLFYTARYWTRTIRERGYNEFALSRSEFPSVKAASRLEIARVNSYDSSMPVRRRLLRTPTVNFSTSSTKERPRPTTGTKLFYERGCSSHVRGCRWLVLLRPRPSSASSIAARSKRQSRGW